MRPGLRRRRCGPARAGGGASGRARGRAGATQAADGAAQRLSGHQPPVLITSCPESSSGNRAKATRDALNMAEILNGSRILRGIAVPPFSDNPQEFAYLGIEVEQAGFDGYFLWDHMVFSNSGDGPPILDPWLILAVVAASTSKIKIGTMVTPVPRRRPWQLAKETTTLDRLSAGRVILGVGIGSPSYGDFGLFGDPSGARDRADLLDEGLDIMPGLWSGERFSYAGEKFKIDPVRFAPTPVQRPRIPVWIAGVLPNQRPIERAARWDGFVPIRFGDSGLVRPSAADIAEVAGQI